MQVDGSNMKTGAECSLLAAPKVSYSEVPDRTAKRENPEDRSRARKVPENTESVYRLHDYIYILYHVRVWDMPEISNISDMCDQDLGSAMQEGQWQGQEASRVLLWVENLKLEA